MCVCACACVCCMCVHVHRRRQTFAGGFQQYVECINARVALPQGGLGLPRKILDFRASEIFSDAFGV